MSITERIRYGAAELKASYNRNLAIGLVIAVAIHAIAIGSYLASVDIVQAGPVHPSDTIPTTVIETFEEVPDILKPLEQPRSNGGAIDTRVKGGSGSGPSKDVPGLKPIITDDSNVSDKSFPTVDEIPFAGVKGSKDGDDRLGDGGKDDGLDAGTRSNPGTTPGTADTLDATAEFYSDVVLPEVDMGDLMTKIDYPRMARQNGIEGSVDVRALIGPDGTAERVEIGTSTNRLFDEAALEAVRAARFKAGLQNKQPVRVWISIPIRFRLD